MLTSTLIIALGRIVFPLQNIKSNSPTKRILIMSSVNNNGWFIMALIISLKTVFIYISIYSSALILIIKQSKIMKNKNTTVTATFWVIIILIRNISGMPLFSLF